MTFSCRWSYPLRSAALALFAMLVSSAPTALALVDPAPLVSGVSEVVSVGALGPIFPVSDAWVPIVGGDDDTSFPALLVVARDYGAGRILAFGHGGTIVNPGVRDNARFLRNAAAWLDVAPGQRIGYTTGHGEWIGGGNLGPWAADIAAAGFTLEAVASPLTAASLAGISVLLVGDAWGTISPSEVDAVEQWVAAGHGLMLFGLGWSWDAYHPGAFEDFPMAKLAAPYGVRWARGGIFDPTNGLDGSPIFHTFYPNVVAPDPVTAAAAIDDTHVALGSGLAAALESDAAVRRRFVRAHQALALVCRELPAGDQLHQTVFDYGLELAAREPASYARRGSFDAASRPTSAWLRERFLRTLVDCSASTPASRQQIAAATEMIGRRREVFVDLGVALFDNDRLTPAELDFVHTFLPLVPAGLTDLRALSAVDFLGSPPLTIGLEGRPQGFNIYVSNAAFNQFPDEVPPGTAIDTAVVIAHEMNHQVDALTIGRSPVLLQRMQRLIADAGDEQLNYLRSMIDTGFFTHNPQEFFASIANQWFVDSAKTLDLGLARFDAGRLDPINQALFFADVYSQGGDVTYFYEMDNALRISRRAVPIHRNATGFIDEIEGSRGRYRFTLDAAGHVTDYVVVDPCATAVPIVGGRLTLSGFATGRDSIQMRAAMTLPVPPDVPTTGLRVVVTDATAVGVVVVTVPSGVYDAATRTGWRGAAGKWTYVTPSLIGSLIRQVKVRTAANGETTVSINGARGTALGALPELPLTLTLVADTSQTPTDSCGRVPFSGSPPAPSCKVSGTNRIRCR